MVVSDTGLRHWRKAAAKGLGHRRRVFGPRRMRTITKIHLRQMLVVQVLVRFRSRSLLPALSAVALSGVSTSSETLSRPVSHTNKMAGQPGYFQLGAFSGRRGSHDGPLALGRVSLLPDLSELRAQHTPNPLDNKITTHERSGKRLGR